MLKQLLLLVMASLGATTMNAQEGQQRWWGYYDGKERLVEFGTGNVEDYHCAMFVSGNKGDAVGKKIVGVRATIQGVGDAKELKLWLSRNLPESGDKASVAAIAVDLSTVSDGQSAEVMLTQPYTIPSSGVYAGYSLITADPYPVLTTQASTTQANGFFLKTSLTYPSWVDVSPFQNGNVAIQVLLDGNFLDHAASPTAFPETVQLCGGEVSLPVVITNEGTEPVGSIDYTVGDDGQEQPERHLDLTEPIAGVKATATLSLPFSIPAEPRASEKTITITRVNGQPNEASAKSSKGTIVAIRESAQRTVVMEEYTGTWCGWCPRGMVGLRLLERDFGEAFIGIAVHDGDPMSISDYASEKSRVSGYPSAFVNRLLAADPYHGSSYGGGNASSYGIYDDVLSQQQALTPIAVSVEATWNTAAMTAFTATASVVPCYDRSSASPYALGYVLLADSLSGEGKSWSQNNDYANVVLQGGYASEPNLGYLTELPDYITDIVFDDVAIATLGISKGITGSVPAPFANGTTITHQQRFNISGNTLVQDKQHLRLVALLFNTKTGEIVNAAECRILTQEQTGVEAYPQSLPKGKGAEAAAIYDMNGRQQSCLQRGLNIVRRSDGKVVKIIR